MDNEEEPGINNHLDDRLPESLEVLRVTGFSTPEQTQFLIDDCCRMLRRRFRIPRLRELSIEAPFDSPDVSFDTKALQHEARRADVQLRKINTNDYSNDEYDMLPPPGCDWGMNGEFKWSAKFV